MTLFPCHFRDAARAAVVLVLKVISMQMLFSVRLTLKFLKAQQFNMQFTRWLSDVQTLAMKALVLS